MNISHTAQPLEQIETDVLVLGVPHKSGIGEALADLDRAMGGVLGSAVSEGAFKGNLFETEWVYPATGSRARRVLLIGTGKADEYDRRLHRLVASVAVRQARRKGAHSVCLVLSNPAGMSVIRGVETIADGVLYGLADSDLYKGRSEKGHIESALIWLDSAADTGEVERGIVRGQKIAHAVNFARWLGDEPANIMTTTRVEEETRKMAQANGLECEVLDEAAIRAAGMNSLLSVSQGSDNPPRVLVLKHNGGGEKPALGLVGKGVTFDTGGISIKPALDMHNMKYDMCGAAAVIGTMQALAQLETQANVIGVAGLVENMPGSAATRPGDIVKAANGKTIEIINTDAEGRLVLADALDLAIKRGAARLVDIATLTGAIKVALGDLTSGIFGGPQSWIDTVLAAAEQSGERLWQMPLYKEYRDNLRSNIADLMNTGGRFGGASNAAAFLQQFVGDTPWAHLDIAGTAWTEKDHAWQMKGATGVMIRTLVALAES